MKRDYMARLRASNPDATREKQRKWHAANREKNTAKMREYYARRFFWAKACKLRKMGAANYTELARLWKKQRGLCALTGRRLSRENAELDHKIPKSRGGGDEIDNLQWVTVEANRAKRDLTDGEFAELCGDVMRWIGDRIQLVEELTKEG
jgi:5-methylcytosine-specific restriction endonuclease McrA